MDKTGFILELYTLNIRNNFINPSIIPVSRAVNTPSTGDIDQSVPRAQVVTGCTRRAYKEGIERYRVV